MITFLIFNLDLKIFLRFRQQSMNILAWFNPCAFANAAIIAFVALILIVALLWRKKSRYDIWLLSIPFFSLIPQIPEMIKLSHFMWSWFDLSTANKMSLIKYHVRGLKQIPHLIFPVIILEAAMVVAIHFKERDRARVERKRRMIKCFSYLLLALAICVPIAW